MMIKSGEAETACSKVRESDRHDTGSQVRQLWQLWLFAEQDLTDLAQQEDRLIEAGEPIPEALDLQSAEATDIQRDAIERLLRMRAVKLPEIAGKLNVWLKHNLANDSDFDALPSSDRLAGQAIKELNYFIGWKD